MLNEEFMEKAMKPMSRMLVGATINGPLISISITSFPPKTP